MKKLLSIDENITFLFAGLNADARKLIDIVFPLHRLVIHALGSCGGTELQSFLRRDSNRPVHRQISRQTATVVFDIDSELIHNRYTQRGGRRPFGVSAFICGIDRTGAHLFQTDPAGICTEWKVYELFRYYAIRQMPVVRVIRTFANTSRITMRRIWKKTKPLNSF